jgi:peroxiredoxin
MKQLVELNKHADEFKALNTELLFVFREEAKGVEGLKMIQDKHDTGFTLAVDPEKKSTKVYSSGKMEFDNFVIDANGVVRGIIDGTLRERATAAELTRILKEMGESK